MVRQKVSAKYLDSGIVSLLLFGAAFTTLYFNTKIQDPFNSPKLWIISLLAAWCMGHLYTKRQQLISSEDLAPLIISTLFLFFGTISLIKTDVSYVGLFGENLRRNGYLSYLSLVVIFLTSILVFKLNALNKIYGTVLLVGGLLSIYGLLQGSGLDFVKWNNPYNSVISTVGNPNFAASIIGIIAVLNFGAMLNRNRKIYLSFIHGAVVVLSIYVIIMSDALQGLIVISIGLSIISITYIYAKSKKLGQIGIIILFASGIAAVLGMLQIGPLTNYLYKDSVSVRGFYWRAGFEMLKENLFFGVGLDRYGAHFKEVREFSYSLRYGFDITSNNAHSVPIQIFSTGGLFMGLAYLALLGYILKCGILSLKKAEANKKLVMATFFSAWLAFQAQTLISIDNIGISIWGWILGGIVIAFSRESAENDFKQSRNSQIKLAQPLLSSFLTLSMLFVVVGLYKNESLMYQTRGVFNPQNQSLRSALYTKSINLVETPLADPAYKIIAANYLFAAGFQDESIKILKQQIERDPRDLDAITSLVQIYEQNKDYKNALQGREKIRVLDPWNSKNLLQLGREYKLYGEIDKMINVLGSINNFDSQSNEAKMANEELVK
jgi:tetratricopeptide (TPR) repeat protein